jgi:hypothetical protein
MKLIKNYNTFIDNNLNENIFTNFFKNLFKKIKIPILNYFQRSFGKDSWLYYSLYLVEKNQIPLNKSGDPIVEIICPDSYLNGMKVKNIPSDEDILAELRSKFKDQDSIPDSEEEVNDKELLNTQKWQSEPDQEKLAKKEEKPEPEKEEDDDQYYVEHFYFPGYDKVNEAVEAGAPDRYTPLDFPTAKNDKGEPVETVRNVDVEDLKDRIERVYKMNALRASRHQKEDYAETSDFQRKKTHALFIWGAPGIGKTEILHEVAEKLDIVVQEWHLATIEPTDFRGVPKVEDIYKDTPNDPRANDPQYERTVSKLPSIFPTSDGNGKGGIMFFDELNRAPAMVLSASLSLALSGKHGTYRLPPRWIVIAAGNRPEDLQGSTGGGGGGQLTDDPILWNRFGHVNFSPKVHNWIAWAMTNPNINPDIIPFLQFNKHFYHRYDQESKRPNWTSPRTWVMASSVEFDLRGRDWTNPLPMTKIQDLYTRAVGRDAALQFTAYLALKAFYDNDDIKSVYEKGAKGTKLPASQYQARAAAVSIAFWKKGEKLPLEDLKNILDFSWTIDEPEQRQTLVTYLRVVHPYIKTDSPYKEVYFEWVKKWHAKDVMGGK